MRVCRALVIALALVACAESAHDSLEAGRSAVAEARYADAIAAADAGLAGEADAVTGWGLELVKLEALARDGQGEAALTQLGALAEARPQNVTAAQYAATADQLRGAGEGAASVQVLDLGLKRFPEDETLSGLIEAAKAAPAAGGEELEMLRSLGYVE